MTTIEKFFQEYAEALMSFSAVKIADHYQVPFAVYADQGSRTVTQMAEVVAFWKEGVKPYASQNIVKASPNVLTEDQLSTTIWTSKVLWTNFDKSGTDVGQETNFYILSNSSGQFKITGLIIMAV